MSEGMHVPEGWEVKTISDILTIQYGKDQKEVEVINGKYPILGTGGVMGYTNNFLYDKPSVLIGRKGTINKPQYMDTPFWTVDTLFYSHIKSEHDPRWVFYIFQSINWNKYNEASGVPSLSTANINRINILRPSFKEQKSIAKILSTFDQAIEATQKLIAKEKNIKKGLMHDLLTNGIDEDGKIRSPQTHNYKESELGLIPEGWEAVQLRDVTKVQQGLQIPIVERYTGRGKNLYPYITIQSLKSENDFEYIMKPKKSVICTTDDVLMTRTGNTGSVITGVNGVFHNNFFSIDFDRKQINKDFLVYFLNSEKVQQEIQLRSGVTTIPDLNHGDFYSINFMKIDIVEQEVIVNILTIQDKKIETEEKNLAKLKELKKGLMDDLLSGKVRVKV